MENYRRELKEAVQSRGYEHSLKNGVLLGSLIVPHLVKIFPAR